MLYMLSDLMRRWCDNGTPPLGCSMYGIGRCWNGLEYGMLLLCENVNGIPTVCEGTFQSELFAKVEVVGLGTTSITTDL